MQLMESYNSCHLNINFIHVISPSLFLDKKKENKMEFKMELVFLVVTLVN